MDEVIDTLNRGVELRLPPSELTGHGPSPTFLGPMTSSLNVCR
jgi:hypothetical protein